PGAGELLEEGEAGVLGARARQLTAIGRARAAAKLLAPARHASPAGASAQWAARRQIHGHRPSDGSRAAHGVVSPPRKGLARAPSRSAGGLRGRSTCISRGSLGAPLRVGGSGMKAEWTAAKTYEDILYEKWEGIAKITINRPEVRNAFRPKTLFEMREAFEDARGHPEIGGVTLTGAGDKAFCSGGDQRIRGSEGYVGSDGVPRLNVLDLQKQIRSLPKPVVAMVAGYAIGGGHVLHVVC